MESEGTAPAPREPLEVSGVISGRRDAKSPIVCTYVYDLYVRPVTREVSGPGGWTMSMTDQHDTCARGLA